MSFRFPIKDVKITQTSVKRQIDNPGYTSNEVRLHQHEFELDMEGLAWIYARNGNSIEVLTYPAFDINTLELYLCGSVYGAILHQRKVLPMHGSCFKFRNMGIMICGESGVGKSSLTAAFCLDGADFLTDDVTPILFNEGIPHIWAISDRIKLHEESLQQLEQTIEGLTRIMPEWEKFYFPMQSVKEKVVPLNHIFILYVHNGPAVRVEPLVGVEKFAALRNEIYRKEFLRGMPESETDYLKQLIVMSQRSTVTKIFRPADMPIRQLQSQLETIISEVEARQNPVSTPYCL